ncbi:TolC family protein [Quatrionicoccus australiensis]|uniref:TolC family protein n=1 Tax=Quatrionicoccus australiensis TaxID=138118 RepID=UPI001CF7F20A|nr:TolC family protein [Quatrionicoccus australiensis]UCV13842.1 TolC family protein [Quatrionicoccus australiensis]
MAISLAGSTETSASKAEDGHIPGAASRPLVQERALNLYQALEHTAFSSPVLERGIGTVDKAKAARAGASGAFLPQFDLSMQFSRYVNEGKQATLIGSTVVQSESAFYGTYAALSSSLNLYSGGRQEAGYRAADSELKAAHEDYENLKVKQFSKVLEDYAALLKAQEEYRSLLYLEELYVSLEEATQKAYQRGIASRLDIGNARLQSGKRHQQALQQLTTLESKAGQLAVSIGLELPEKERLQAADSLPPPPALPEIKATPSTDETLAEHPALRAAQQRVEAARNKISAARGMFLPKVDLVGNYNWSGRDNASASNAVDATKANSYSFGLLVQQHLPPFTGETTALQTAQAELREAEAQLKETRLGLLNAKKQALAEFAQARRSLDIARQAEKEADEALMLHRARRQHGRSDEQTYTEAQANAVQRRLERFFQETNYRLIGWAAQALLSPRHYLEILRNKLQ